MGSPLSDGEASLPKPWVLLTPWELLVLMLSVGVPTRGGGALDVLCFTVETWASMLALAETLFVLRFACMRLGVVRSSD